jgi:hypothetical protein
MTLMLFSGAWGKMIYEKNPAAKNLVTLSLNLCCVVVCYKQEGLEKRVEEICLNKHHY